MLAKKQNKSWAKQKYATDLITLHSQMFFKEVQLVCMRRTALTTCIKITEAL